MSWQSLALTCLGSTLDALLGSGGVSAADFRAALADAVDEVKRDTRIALLESRLNELRGRIDGVQTILRDYIQTRHQPLLDTATTDSADICGQLMFLQHPDFPVLIGLPGHTLFMVAASLRAQILKKRIENNEPPDPLRSHLDVSMEHAELMQLMWGNYNWARYIGPFTIPEAPVSGVPYAHVRFCYRVGLVDGEVVKTRFTADLLPFTDDYDAAERGAAQVVESERARAWQVLEAEIVVPSEQVVAQWLQMRNTRFGRVSLSAIKERVATRLERTAGTVRVTTGRTVPRSGPQPPRPPHG